MENVAMREIVKGIVGNMENGVLVQLLHRA